MRQDAYFLACVFLSLQQDETIKRFRKGETK